MGSPPAFQFYADDFYAGVSTMTDAEVGIYVRLLCLSWAKGLLDVKSIRAATYDGDEDMVRSVLAEKFEQTEGGQWYNARLEKVRETQLSRSKAGSKGGSKTQAKRKANVKAKRQANGQAKVKPPSPVSSLQSTTPSSVPSSNTGDKSPARSSKFVKPTHSEVKAYCNERGNSVDPEVFIDHYTSNGWKVGKNSMRDWKAAVRTWEKNSFGAPTKTETHWPLY